MCIGTQMDTDGHIPLADNVSIKDAGFTLPSSSPVDVINQKPAKKPTRQWAAWTRQEEENFFTALREVGKNFEKITCRVQSKNKDQVRHYYYRLVRRMNKLLGPGLCLDAKNSKDTNAAMLRWWSLLEKYSCTASKLHLKPRRFKIFVEALESQLLKDRNKTRRRHPLRDIYIPTPSTAIICRGPANDARPVKLLAIDNQTTDKVGATNRASFKVDVKADINFNKGDASSVKTVRQKRKAGSAQSAAYRRWEKAAMAGVSLVADAAEQLERATHDGNSSFNEVTDHMFSNEVHTINGICSHQIREKIREPPVKLKLQLFPIDERTRKALEKDAHNPHLELTLSARKRISSVLEHLNRKWGDSSAACGELMFFPYSVQQEELASYHKWTTKDSVASAGDVYITIGSPSVFRLRYGWFSTAELGSSDVQVSGTALQCKSCTQSKNVQKGHDHTNDPHTETETINTDAPTVSHVSEQLIDCSEEQATSVMAFATSVVDIPESTNEANSLEPKDGFPESKNQTTASLIGEEIEDQQIREQENDEINLGVKCTTMSAAEWADGLTNISVGELLSEVSKAANSSSMSSPAGGSVPCLQQIPFSCDSFDAAIAAHVSDHQLLTSQVSRASIWDAEETCDEFSFKMFPDLKQKNSSSNNTSTGACKQNTLTSSLQLRGCHEELAGTGPADDASGENLKAKQDSTKESCNGKQNSPKDPCLTDIYWPDSLGPWDLDIPSTKYEGQNLVFSDSLNGFSRIVASSLDAFQNCSFFSMDKKDSLASEACGPLFSLEDKVFSE